MLLDAEEMPFATAGSAAVRVVGDVLRKVRVRYSVGQGLRVALPTGLIPILVLFGLSGPAQILQTVVEGVSIDVVAECGSTP